MISALDSPFAALTIAAMKVLLVEDEADLCAMLV